MMTTRNERKQHIFFLRRTNNEAMRLAQAYLSELGVRVTNRQGNAALMGLATPSHVEAAYESGLFAAITAKTISEESLRKYAAEHQEAARLWNAILAPERHEQKKERTHEGRSWADPERETPPPHSLIDPRDFKRALLAFLKVEEEQFLEPYKDEKPPNITGKRFEAYERRLERAYDNPTVAYHLARLAWHLEPAYRLALLKLPIEFIIAFFLEAACWKMENEIAVGVVFVESSREGGPKFSGSQRTTLQAEIVSGLDWLAGQAPVGAHLTWVYDWQFVKIDVANGNNNSTEDYWRDPAMGEVSYFGNSYAEAWSSVAAYRDDMRVRNASAHAIVIFVTPYGTEWHAYAGGSRITLANRNNWGGWGIGTIDRITAHETCHLFGAADEYTGSGTPCSTCGSTHGCYHIPNGNCGSCARPQQACIMDGNSPRLCAYTQGQIGWADLFVELTTADTLWAGTDDTVWLDIGDRTFVLDNPNHDDREQNNVEGYALNYTGVVKADVKRVGIRKSADGFAGGWKLKRVRLWVRGELICDANNINQWLEDEYLWWASSSCGSATSIVNRLQVKVSTADVMWAGTDDDVRLYLGGRSWNLDNEGHDDFERGHTDTFDLDPGTGLYKPSLASIRIYKSPDGVAGGWRLKGLQILVNGASIYNNQSINKWLEDDDRNWYGMI
ncbi:MAG: hypothetical protein KDE09_03945 [Anaerolineales bacterium]|nr:hypothetical protein [Anaerolineales bacterium]